MTPPCKDCQPIPFFALFAAAVGVAFGVGFLVAKKVN